MFIEGSGNYIDIEGRIGWGGCKKYRPISLLNTDYKIYARILVNRLKEYLVDHINEDQAGFLPRCHLKDNLRFLLNVIEVYDKSPDKRLGLIFVDMEKVFNNLNWEFMTNMLEEIGIGTNFINAIKGIYKNQKSYLIINDDRTRDFSVWKGTRQGCPLSPLLFIFVLEILLSRVRVNKEIIGLKRNKYEYKYRTFTDDVLFITEDPINTLAKLLEEVRGFGELVGFPINYKKNKGL